MNLFSLLSVKPNRIINKLYSTLLDEVHPLRKLQIEIETSFHGTGYGGWALYPNDLNHNSIIFSIGIGEDASFDRSVIDAYRAQVYAFDPTPRSLSWMKKQDWPDQFHFYPFGLAAENGTRTFHPPDNPEHVSHTLIKKDQGSAIEVEFRTITSLAELTGKTKIDVLKMDIEGAEYEVIPDLVSRSEIENSQVLVEFHHFFPEISIRDTFKMIRLLNQAGYRVFHISDNGYEYSFIRT